MVLTWAESLTVGSEITCCFLDLRNASFVIIKPTLLQSIGQTYKEFFYLQSEIAVGCFEFFNIILEMSLYLQL